MAWNLMYGANIYSRFLKGVFIEKFKPNSLEKCEFSKTYLVTLEKVKDKVKSF